MILISSSFSNGEEIFQDIFAYKRFLSSGIGTEGYWLEMSKETRISLGGIEMSFIFSTKSMEFFMEYWDWKLILCENVLDSHLQILKVGALVKDAMGRMGIFSLWSLGRPYWVGAWGFIMVKRNFLELGKLIGQLDIRDFTLFWNFGVGSFFRIVGLFRVMKSDIFCTYWDFLRIVIVLPLSALEMIKLSWDIFCLMDFKVLE